MGALLSDTYLHLHFILLSLLLPPSPSPPPLSSTSYRFSPCLFYCYTLTPTAHPHPPCPPGSSSVPEFFRIMSRQFTAHEWSIIQSAGSEDQQLAAFYRHWVGMATALPCHHTVLLLGRTGCFFFHVSKKETLEKSNCCCPLRQTCLYFVHTCVNSGFIYFHFSPAVHTFCLSVSASLPHRCTLSLCVPFLVFSSCVF